MKKTYAFLIVGICLLAGCSNSSKDKQAVQTLSPTVYESKKEIPLQDAFADSSGYDFLIERYKLQDNGLNITVDSALELLIDKVNPAASVTLKKGQRIAYQFQGYELHDDGNCYVIGFGTNSKNGFNELYRYAISYNKTIYEMLIFEGNETKYKEVYSLDEGSSKSSNSLITKIENGVLYIKERNSSKTISSFPLSKLGLKNTKESEVTHFDMNFDGYTDVAIKKTKNNGDYSYHAFIYDSLKNKFNYHASYANLISPAFDYDDHRILCSTIGKQKMTYDSYWINNDEPEIKERTTYTYQENEKNWRMDHYIGEQGELTLNESNYYTSEETSSLTGEYIETE